MKSIFQKPDTDYQPLIWLNSFLFYDSWKSDAELFTEGWHLKLQLCSDTDSSTVNSITTSTHTHGQTRQLKAHHKPCLDWDHSEHPELHTYSSTDLKATVFLVTQKHEHLPPLQRTSQGEHGTNARINTCRDFIPFADLVRKTHHKNKK